jgi:CHAD domain-containing protein
MARALLVKGQHIQASYHRGDVMKFDRAIYFYGVSLLLLSLWGCGPSSTSSTRHQQGVANGANGSTNADGESNTGEGDKDKKKEPAVPKKDDKRTYIELAYDKVPKNYGELLKSLEATLNEDTLPHEAKKVRKQIGYFKAYLDIFVYAFPDQEKWAQLREDTDDGYTVVGAFKDIFDALEIEVAVYDEKTKTWSEGTKPEDIPYDPVLVNARRKDVLDWLSKYADSEYTSQIDEFLSNPPEELSAPVKEELSRFYWGGVAESPDLDQTGAKNVRLLASKILEKAKSDYPEVLTLTDLTVLEQEEKMHDFRKRIRSVLQIIELFEEIYPSSYGDEPSFKFLDKLVDRYGDVHDSVVAYHLALDTDETARASELKAEVTQTWDELIQWQNDKNITAAVNDLEDIL